MTPTGERLRMFPLGTVVFPFSAVPLRVFEPRYLDLVDAVLAERGTFGTVLIERGSEVGGGDTRSLVGTRLQVLVHQQLPEGQRAIVAGGTERIRVREWLDDDPHPWAMVEPWSDAADDPGDLVPTVCSRLERLLMLASEMGADTAGTDLAVTEGDDPVAVSYRLAALIPVTASDSYSLLVAAGPAERLARSVAMLDDQIELIRLQLSGS